MTYETFVDYFDHSGLFPYIREYMDEQGVWWRCSSKKLEDGRYHYTLQPYWDGDLSCFSKELVCSDTDLRKIHENSIDPTI